MPLASKLFQNGATWKNRKSLNYLETSHDIAFGIGQGLSLLESDQLRDVLQVVLDQGLVLEHHLLASKRRRFGPGLGLIWSSGYRWTACATINALAVLCLDKSKSTKEYFEFESLAWRQRDGLCWITMCKFENVNITPAQLWEQKSRSEFVLYTFTWLGNSLSKSRLPTNNYR